MGANPGPVPRGRPLLAQERIRDLPAGLPTRLVERRPDVRAAEQLLVATNARIGEAKAELFPTLRLRVIGGTSAADLLNTFTFPIFNAGLLRSEVEATESLQRQAKLGYLKAVQQAFNDVANALVACNKTDKVRRWNERLEEARRDQASLSMNRFRGDQTSLLEVLVSERDLLKAELSLSRAIRDELNAYVSLYRALGGGWQGVDPIPASS